MNRTGSTITTLAVSTTTIDAPITACSPASDEKGKWIPSCACNGQQTISWTASMGSDGGTTYRCDVSTKDFPMTTYPPRTSVAPTSVTPTSTVFSPAPAETCHTHYQGIYDTIDIYGTGWNTAALDGNGGPGSGVGLKNQVKGCGKLTKWTFENLTPDANSPWEFHASGRLPIWTKACLKRAMISAGSPANICSGSG